MAQRVPILPIMTSRHSIFVIVLTIPLVTGRWIQTTDHAHYMESGGMVTSVSPISVEQTVTSASLHNKALDSKRKKLISGISDTNMTLTTENVSTETSVTNDVGIISDSVSDESINIQSNNTTSPSAISANATGSNVTTDKMHDIITTSTVTDATGGVDTEITNIITASSNLSPDATGGVDTEITHIITASSNLSPDATVTRQYSVTSEEAELITVPPQGLDSANSYKTQTSTIKSTAAKSPALTIEQIELLGRHFKSILKAGAISEKTEFDDLLQEDEPFGSAIWRDQKYMISVMIPIGVGITGAMIIMVMAYASKICKKENQEEQTSILSRIITQPSATGSKPDNITLLRDSSDEEF